ncbi:hypothetical protein V5799_027599 [Amblyomma americanum]|uniref:CCHC-type domain-containing protein n=1 Tax=Amblyomma americanum TaxID=6943 RepID=A0AAQ4DF94_AMBAM
MESTFLRFEVAPPLDDTVFLFGGSFFVRRRRTLYLLTDRALSVKRGYCAIIDPCRKAIKVNVHWVPFQIPSENLRVAVSEFGEVMEIRHEEWNVPGFQSAESTTRIARMVLKEVVAPEELPHLFKLYGGSVLVVVPGRAPVCLRCHRRGHIRRDCQTPRRTKCHAFGHVREDCIPRYANGTGAALEDCGDKDETKDIEEAETTALMTVGRRVRLVNKEASVAEMRKHRARRRTSKVL